MRFGRCLFGAGDATQAFEVIRVDNAVMRLETARMTSHDLGAVEYDDADNQWDADGRSDADRGSAVPVSPCREAVGEP